MRRTKEEAEATRLSIMENALMLFSEHGISRTSLVDVAERTGVTRGAIYWHFKNKWELFEAIWRYYSQPLDKLSAASGEETENDPLGKLSDLLRYVFTGIAEREDFRRMFILCMRERSICSEEPEKVRAMFDEYHVLRKKTLENAVRKGQLPMNFDVEAGVMMLHSSVEGIILNWVREPDRFNLKERTEQFIEAIIGSLQHCLRLMY